MQIFGFPIAMTTANCCDHYNLNDKRNDAMTELEEMENRDQVNEKAKKFILDDCGCALGEKGGPCSLQFSEGEVLFNLNNC